jgi:hypothetical protein
LDLTNSTLLLKSLSDNLEDIDGYNFSLSKKILAKDFIKDARIDNGIKAVLYGLSREKKYIEDNNIYAVVKANFNDIIYLQDNLYKCAEVYVCYVGYKTDSYKFMIDNHNKNDHLLQKIINKSNFYIKEYNTFFIEQYFAKYEE